MNPETDDLSSIQPKLFYNDYNEWVVSRSDAIVHFLTEEPWNENHEKVTSPVIHPDGDGTIYGDGLIDGIGMQGHLDDTQNIEQYMTALEKYDAAVVKYISRSWMSVVQEVTQMQNSTRQSSTMIFLQG